jgi:hypothetical protein
MLARRETQQNQRWQEESEDEQLERQTGFVACVGTITYDDCTEIK